VGRYWREGGGDRDRSDEGFPVSGFPWNLINDACMLQVKTHLLRISRDSCYSVEQRRRSCSVHNGRYSSGSLVRQLRTMKLIWYSWVGPRRRVVLILEQANWNTSNNQKNCTVFAMKNNVHHMLLDSRNMFCCIIVPYYIRLVYGHIDHITSICHGNKRQYE
jgi:hypothetical protein